MHFPVRTVGRGRGRFHSSRPRWLTSTCHHLPCTSPPLKEQAPEKGRANVAVPTGTLNRRGRATGGWLGPWRGWWTPQPEDHWRNPTLGKCTHFGSTSTVSPSPESRAWGQTSFPGNFQQLSYSPRVGIPHTLSHLGAQQVATLPQTPALPPRLIEAPKFPQPKRSPRASPQHAFLQKLTPVQGLRGLLGAQTFPALSHQTLGPCSLPLACGLKLSSSD